MGVVGTPQVAEVDHTVSASSSSVPIVADDVVASAIDTDNRVNNNNNNNNGNANSTGQEQHQQQEHEQQGLTGVGVANERNSFDDVAVLEGTKAATVAKKMNVTPSSSMAVTATNTTSTTTGGATNNTIVLAVVQPQQHANNSDTQSFVNSTTNTDSVNNSAAEVTSLETDSIQQKQPQQQTTSNTLNRMHRTASAKGKHLTRSHAMRESASPPRIPTSRVTEMGSTDSGGGGGGGPITIGTSNGGGSGMVAIGETPGVVNEMNSPPAVPPPQIFSTDNGGNTSQLDLDFPKLNAPKPKSPRNPTMGEKSQMSESGKSSDALSPTAAGVQYKQSSRKDSNSRNLSPCSQNSHKEASCLLENNNDNSPLLSPGSYDNGNYGPRDSRQSSSVREQSKSPSSENRGNGGAGPNSFGNQVSGNKKHKSGPGSKGTKPRLKAQGSSQSAEGGGGSGASHSSTVFISKDNSFEQFTDQSGVDLIKFFKETLNKNTKDRATLLKIEKELQDLATDRSRHQVKFPSMSSYNRMLIHRSAAYFGMDHNVDASQTSVIVEVTKSTRLPEVNFETLIRETMSDEPRKSILKRDAHSFDECRQSLLPNPDRGLLDRKSKSFEEREEEYEKVRRRIFKGRDMTGYRGIDFNNQEEYSWPWSSTESSDNSGRMRAPNNRLLKVHSLSVDTRHDRPSVSKSHSFGGYGGISHPPPAHGNNLNRGDSITSTKSAGPRFYTKQDSVGSTNTPWRLSPSSSGSIYYFDPSNLPPTAIKMGTNFHNMQRHYQQSSQSMGTQSQQQAPYRRKGDKQRSPAMENKENSMISVIPEDQYHQHHHQHHHHHQRQPQLQQSSPSPTPHHEELEDHHLQQHPLDVVVLNATPTTTLSPYEGSQYTKENDTCTSPEEEILATDPNNNNDNTNANDNKYNEVNDCAATDVMDAMDNNSTSNNNNSSSNHSCTNGEGNIMVMQQQQQQPLKNQATSPHIPLTEDNIEYTDDHHHQQQIIMAEYQTSTCNGLDSATPTMTAASMAMTTTTTLDGSVSIVEEVAATTVASAPLLTLSSSTPLDSMNVPIPLSPLMPSSSPLSSLSPSVGGSMTPTSPSVDHTDHDRAADDVSTLDEPPPTGAISPDDNCCPSELHVSDPSPAINVVPCLTTTLTITHTTTGVTQMSSTSCSIDPLIIPSTITTCTTSTDAADTATHPTSTIATSNPITTSTIVTNHQPSHHNHHDHTPLNNTSNSTDTSSPQALSSSNHKINIVANGRKSQMTRHYGPNPNPQDGGDCNEGNSNGASGGSASSTPLVVTSYQQPHQPTFVLAAHPAHHQQPHYQQPQSAQPHFHYATTAGGALQATVPASTMQYGGAGGNKHRIVEEQQMPGAGNVIMGGNVIGYTTGDGQIYPATNLPYATATYQPTPDGGGYMVYAYQAASPIDATGGEMAGYYVPVYDQNGAAATAMVPAREAMPATAILQAQQGATATPVYATAAPTATGGFYAAGISTNGQVIYAPAVTADGQYAMATTGTLPQNQQYFATTATYAAAPPPGATLATYSPFGAAATYNTTTAGATTTYHPNYWGHHQPMAAATTYYVSPSPQTMLPTQQPTGQVVSMNQGNVHMQPNGVVSATAVPSHTSISSTSNRRGSPSQQAMNGGSVAGSNPPTPHSMTPSLNSGNVYAQPSGQPVAFSMATEVGLPGSIYTTVPIVTASGQPAMYSNMVPMGHVPTAVHGTVSQTVGSGSQMTSNHIQQQHNGSLSVAPVATTTIAGHAVQQCYPTQVVQHSVTGSNAHGKLASGGSPPYSDQGNNSSSSAPNTPMQKSPPTIVPKSGILDTSTGTSNNATPPSSVSYDKQKPRKPFIPAANSVGGTITNATSNNAVIINSRPSSFHPVTTYPNNSHHNSNSSYQKPPGVHQPRHSGTGGGPRRNHNYRDSNTDNGKAMANTGPVMVFNSGYQAPPHMQQNHNQAPPPLAVHHSGNVTVPPTYIHQSNNSGGGDASTVKATTPSGGAMGAVAGGRGTRSKPANLDLRRTGPPPTGSGSQHIGQSHPNQGVVSGSGSQRNTPSTNSTESNNSPNSISSVGVDHHQHGITNSYGHNNGSGAGSGYNRSSSYHGSVTVSGSHFANHGPPPQAQQHHHPVVMAAAAAAAPHHHHLISAAAYGFKYGQTYFPQATLTRRSPSNDLRAQMNPGITAAGLYPMNMMMPGSYAPRHSNPRHSSYHKGGATHMGGNQSGGGSHNNSHNNHHGGGGSSGGVGSKQAMQSSVTATSHSVAPATTPSR